MQRNLSKSPDFPARIHWIRRMRRLTNTNPDCTVNPWEMNPCQKSRCAMDACGSAESESRRKETQNQSAGRIRHKIFHQSQQIQYKTKLRCGNDPHCALGLSSARVDVLSPRHLMRQTDPHASHARRPDPDSSTRSNVSVSVAIWSVTQRFSLTLRCSRALRCAADWTGVRVSVRRKEGKPLPSLLLHPL